jgi:hypothetical protein
MLHRAAAQTALQLDETRAEAHSSLTAMVFVDAPSSTTDEDLQVVHDRDRSAFRRILSGQTP